MYNVPSSYFDDAPDDWSGEEEFRGMENAIGAGFESPSDWRPETGNKHDRIEVALKPVKYKFFKVGDTYINFRDIATLNKLKKPIVDADSGAKLTYILTLMSNQGFRMWLTTAQAQPALKYLETVTAPCGQ